ncbi:MAG TPA: hypothetical protein VFE21_06310 [Rubrobacteraceae bacterium]|nr:hypothetical protein [Rubrobacteraceae bacterium]
MDSFRDEVNRAIRVLTSGDVEAVRDYILSYGAWAPVVSAALMVLQALLTFVPSLSWPSPTAWRSARSGVGC